MDVFNFIALKSQTNELWLQGYCDFPSQFTPISHDRNDRSRRRLGSAAGALEMSRAFQAKGNRILPSPSSSWAAQHDRTSRRSDCGLPANAKRLLALKPACLARRMEIIGENVPLISHYFMKGQPGSGSAQVWKRNLRSEQFE
jgi:hypothetical protein